MISYDEHAKERSYSLDQSLDLVQRRQVHELELLHTVESTSKLQMQTNEKSNARVDSTLNVINLQMDDVKNSQNEVVQQLQSLVGATIARDLFYLISHRQPP
jgi:septation ring formation regulator EzrA